MDTLPDATGRGRGVYFELIDDGPFNRRMVLAVWNGGRFTDSSAAAVVRSASLGNLSYQQQDLNLRLVVQGRTLNGSAWTAGSPERATPSLTATLPRNMDQVWGHVVLVTGGRTTEAPIAFRHVTVVPEPMAWRLSLVGLAMLFSRG
jgi:hypothetical protein